jgi:uncharacterized protein YjbJ (UPF0337 family)
MNPRLTANWNIAKGKTKQLLARLMQDEHPLFAEGKTDELIGRIQKRAAENRGEFRRTAASFKD